MSLSSSPKAFPPLIVRPLLLEDLPAISQLFGLAFPNPWPDSWVAKVLRHPAGFHWGAWEEPSHLVAFFLGVLSDGDLDVVSIAVHPDFQGRGLGKAFLKKVLALPGIRKTFLEVDPENAAAMHLYETVGFRRLSLRKKYYEGKRDAWLMWRGPSPIPDESNQ